MEKRVVFLFIKNMKNFVVLLLLLAASIASVFLGLCLNFINSINCAAAIEVSSGCSNMAAFSTANLPNLKDLVSDFLGKGKQTKKDSRIIMVYPGGFPLGFTLDCQGVVVIAIGDVITERGNEKPLENKNVKVGDIIYSINGEIITSSLHMQTLLNQENNNQDKVELEIHRGSEIFKEIVVRKKEISTGLYRLGLWIRDNAAGVGTLTYVRQDNFRFGALGHPVCDIDTGRVMPVSGGNIYKCNIVGYNKGLRGNPGELRGLFLKNGLHAGVLDNNNSFGVYGVIEKSYIDKMNVNPIQVGFRDSVKTGKATILSTIDGSEPIEYNIEIVKINYQDKSDKKSMVIRVTDERLIKETGGIVQGMSGSPIIQNGKLIGAVTHVFVSDPTKGFGVYIDWMIDN